MQTLKQFYQTFGWYYVRIWTIHVAALAGVFVLDFRDILAIFIAGLFFNHAYQLIFHDWISHDYIRPRNTVFKWLCLMLFYSQDNTIRKKKNYHVFHHQNWQNAEVDPTQQKLKNRGLFEYLFALHSPVAQNIPVREVSLLENEPVIKFFDQHSKLVYFATLVMAFAILPMTWFLAVAIYFPCINTVLGNYHDFYFHGPMQGQDKNLLTTVYGTQAWHIAHHQSWREEYYGPGWWFLINPTWYYRQLFFERV